MIGDESGRTIILLGTKTKIQYEYMGKGGDLGQDDDGRTAIVKQLIAGTNSIWKQWINGMRLWVGLINTRTVNPVNNK